MPEKFHDSFIIHDSRMEPPNPRLQELRSRYKDLNREEKAELMGLNIFPNNPRGAELRKKEALGLMDDKEKEELRRLYQTQTKKEENSPAIQELWKRVAANDAAVEQVDMGQGKSIEVTRTDDEKVIWTFGLCGCNCAIVFTEHDDGTRDCILTHYSTIQLSENMQILRDLIKTSKRMKTAKNKKVILALPGGWIRNAETNKVEMRIHDQRALRALTLLIQVELGTDSEIKLEPYSIQEETRQKDNGTIAVYVPPTGKGDVHYKTWYSSEKLTEKE